MVCAPCFLGVVVCVCAGRCRGLSPCGAAGCPGGARCGDVGYVSGTSCIGFCVLLSLAGGGWLVVFREEFVLVVPSVSCVDNLVEVVSCFE